MYIDCVEHNLLRSWKLYIVGKKWLTEMSILFKKNWRTFLWGHRVLDFWWCLPWVSKPGWIPHLHVLLPACNGLLRFTSSTTPADLLLVVWWPWQSSLFNPYTYRSYIHKHWWGSNPWPCVLHHNALNHLTSPRFAGKNTNFVMLVLSQKLESPYICIWLTNSRWLTKVRLYKKSKALFEEITKYLTLC